MINVIMTRALLRFDLGAKDWVGSRGSRGMVVWLGLKRMHQRLARVPCMPGCKKRCWLFSRGIKQKEGISNKGTLQLQLREEGNGPARNLHHPVVSVKASLDHTCVKRPRADVQQSNIFYHIKSNSVEVPASLVTNETINAAACMTDTIM
jgi:hypothetical protein